MKSTGGKTFSAIDLCIFNIHILNICHLMTKEYLPTMYIRYTKYSKNAVSFMFFFFFK